MKNIKIMLPSIIIPTSLPAIILHVCIMPTQNEIIVIQLKHTTVMHVPIIIIIHSINFVVDY